MQALTRPVPSGRQHVAGAAPRTVVPFTAGARLVRMPLVRAQPEQKQQEPPAQSAPGDEPPWVRREREREMERKEGKKDLPWGVYLMFSTFTAIAAVGSIFEFLDKNPIAGVIPVDSPLWAPILLFFAVTGLPTAGFLFIKGVNGFNDDAERQDKLDGYL